MGSSSPPRTYKRKNSSREIQPGERVRGKGRNQHDTDDNTSCIHKTVKEIHGEIPFGPGLGKIPEIDDLRDKRFVRKNGLIGHQRAA